MTSSSIEPLESRIAPANLLSPTTFTYTDVDGDNVKVTFSKPILTAANFDTLVNLDGGLDGTGPQDLYGFDLFDLGPSANGLNITIVATPSRALGGDGVVAGVYIDASEIIVEDEGTEDETTIVIGIDLGTVKIDGDLTRIDAGDDDFNTPALKNLIVKSVGLIEPGVLSDIYGPVGNVRVAGDFAGYFFAASENLLVDDFKMINIRGSILGNLGEDAGRIFAGAGIGTIIVGRDVIGGNFAETGSIRSIGPIGKTIINGSLIGGDGDDTGRIRALEMNTVGLRGSLIGGYGHGSGVIETYYGNINSVAILGSVIGGLGDGTATIQSGNGSGGDGTLKSVFIKGSVIGVLPESGLHSKAATIRADNSIGKITILGALVNANISAGVEAGADERYATADDTLTVGFPDEPRRLGPVVIKGGVYATMPGFGITAQTIASIQAGGPILRPGGPFADFDAGFLLGSGAGIQVWEF